MYPQDANGRAQCICPWILPSPDDSLSFIAYIHQLQLQQELSRLWGRKVPYNHFSPGSFSIRRVGLGSSLYHIAGAQSQ